MAIPPSDQGSGNARKSEGKSKRSGSLKSARQNRQDHTGREAASAEVPEPHPLNGFPPSAQAPDGTPWAAQILESVADGFIALDRDWRCHCVNKAAAAFLKTTPQEAVGKVLWDAFPRLRDSRFHQGFTRAVQEKTFVQVEDYYEPLGRWYECRCHPTEEGLTVFINDATHHRKLEERLLESRQALDMAITGSNAGVWRIDLNPDKPGYMPDYVYLSPQLKALMGFESHEFPNSRSAWQDRILPEDRPLLEQAAQAHAEGRTEMYQVDFRIRHKDGGIRWFTSRGRLYRDEFNRPIRWAGIDTDITDRKLAAEILRESEARLRQALDAGRVFTFEWHPGTDEVRRSPNSAPILGWTDDATRDTGQGYFERVHPEDRAAFVRRVSTLAPDRAGYETTYRYLRRDDGREVVLEESGHAVFDESGMMVCLRGLTRDVTERTRMEESLRQANEQLQEQAEDLTSTNEELHAQQEELQIQAEELQAQAQELREANRRATWLARFPQENPNPVLRVSADGSVLYANPACAEVPGWACEVGQPLPQAVLDHLVREAMAEGRAFEQDVELGETYYAVGVFPIQAECYANIYGRDITDRKWAELALRQLNEELEQRVEERTVDLKKANEALRQAGDYNRSLIEASLDPLVTIGPDGRITDVNRASEEVTGFSRAELIDTDFSDYFTEPEKADEGYRQVFHNGSVHDYPLEVRHKDGGVTPVLYNATVYRDEAGQVIGVFAAARDVTEIRRAEQARARLAAIVESSDDVIIGKDLDGNITSWNRGAQRTYGYAAEEVIGRSVSLLAPSESRDEFEQILVRTRRGEAVEHFETVRITKDGRSIHVSLTVSPIRDATGRVTGASSIARDITDRKRAEEAVKAERQRLYDVLDTLPAYVVLMSKDYHVPFANRFFRERFGESHDRCCFEYLFERTEPCENCESYKVLQTHAPHHGSGRVPTAATTTSTTSPSPTVTARSSSWRWASTSPTENARKRRWRRPTRRWSGAWKSVRPSGRRRTSSSRAGRRVADRQRGTAPAGAGVTRERGAVPCLGRGAAADRLDRGCRRRRRLVQPALV